MRCAFYWPSKSETRTTYVLPKMFTLPVFMVVYRLRLQAFSNMNNTWTTYIVVCIIHSCIIRTYQIHCLDNRNHKHLLSRRSIERLMRGGRYSLLPPIGTASNRWRHVGRRIRLVETGWLTCGSRLTLVIDMAPGAGSAAEAAAGLDTIPGVARRMERYFIAGGYELFRSLTPQQSITCFVYFVDTF